jgi:hypothetical protein
MGKTYKDNPEKYGRKMKEIVKTIGGTKRSIRPKTKSYRNTA